ncbi:quinoprotein dehydrogenase-associated putative ABC transporter substrate-binding protein [Azohydromonas aeria]|uniref:quinoprotein dehydrogenase-associated putative ABC transporter substrate-binding protein n=1 Tax=Azohydromonas aeria TaxID=2590212 RepID=UPI0012FCC1C8|nr:quinoprotein dehydrogenase-associated putative ABC transporter substrate-binding protein [Azohydromonas aeria]
MRHARRAALAAALVALSAGLAGCASAPGPGGVQQRVLRVCADPDNAPLSHRDGSGFENRIAELLAQALGARLEVHWQPMQGRIVATTLGARRCDVLLGVPAGFARTATSRPYYRSGFVWVQRGDAAPLRGVNDPRLAGRRIGVPSVRHDVTATPPALLLHERGAGAQLVGYAVEEGHAAERLVRAVAEGRLDAAALWGAQAGWHVRSRPGLRMSPIEAAGDSGLPMEVSMALAVRPGDQALLAELDQALARHRVQIEAILRGHGVPLEAP